MTDLGVPFGKASWRAFRRIGVGLRPDAGDDIDEIVQFPLQSKNRHPKP